MTENVSQGKLHDNLEGSTNWVEIFMAKTLKASQGNPKRSTN